LTDGEYVLVRDPELEVFLDSPDVSRRHARITIAGEEATIEDLESKNGTFVADRKLQTATRLAGGDTIRLGSFELTFTAIRNLGSTRSVPSNATGQSG
jgi:pSer/pThr/pTyr-binding forkhead associated (FHA) protein